MTKVLGTTLTILLAMLFVRGLSSGQPPPVNSTQTALASWGELSTFPPLYVDAVGTFLRAEKEYREGAYTTSSRILDNFWTQYPPGSRVWQNAVEEARTVAATAGANFGTPAAYYALRMLTDAVDWRLREDRSKPQGSPIELTVLVAGQSEANANGERVQHTIRPQLAINESLYLFCEYVQAISKGELNVNIHVEQLPDLTVPVEMSRTSLQVAGQPRSLLSSGLAPNAMDKIWGAVDRTLQAKTDWWFILYPSHVPENAGRTEYITGGMATGPDGRSPAFVIDDLWLVRNPPHLGTGALTEEARRIWLPQWFQHEFFHHLYRAFPDRHLESSSHQWFDRSTWPSDFEGALEPDYFHETVFKRLAVLPGPDWDVAMRYAAPDKSYWDAISLADLTGEYRAEPRVNNWMQGHIERVPTTNGLRWVNDDGVSWRLAPRIEDGILETTSDNPYYGVQPSSTRNFKVFLRRGLDGQYTREIAGFQFLGSFYAKLR